MNKRQIYSESAKKYLFNAVLSKSEKLDSVLFDLELLASVCFSKLIACNDSIEESDYLKISKSIEKNLETVAAKELLEVVAREKDFFLLKSIVKDLLANIFVINITIDDAIIVPGEKKKMLNHLILKKYKGGSTTIYFVSILNQSGKVLESYFLDPNDSSSIEKYDEKIDKAQLFNTLFDLFLHLEIRGRNE